MGTHVQLFYLQKITYQPTWLAHIPSTEQENASGVFTSLTPRALSEETEKRAGRLGLREGFLGSETAEVGERRKSLNKPRGSPHICGSKGQLEPLKGLRESRAGKERRFRSAKPTLSRVLLDIRRADVSNTSLYLRRRAAAGELGGEGGQRAGQSTSK